MLVSILWPLAIAILGLVLYLITPNAKGAEVGKIMFAAGMFAVAFALSHYTLRLP